MSKRWPRQKQVLMFELKEYRPKQGCCRVNKREISKGGLSELAVTQGILTLINMPL